MKKLIIISMTLITSFCHSELTEEQKIQKTKAIIEKAEKDWPNNYSMQGYAIESEVKAMIELEKIKDRLKKGLK